ncbi:MAG TPA: hypothetical protein VF008_32075 [Niastella sp.]
MKTSNKLLLAIFLSIILLTTAVQLMVYAKYKRGDYVKFDRDIFSSFTKVDIPAVRFISITGMGNISIMPGDTSKLEIQKEKVSPLTYRVVNDTLIVIGDSTHAIDDPERGNRNYNHVNVYLPATVQINASNSVLRVGGADDSTIAPSYTVKLEKDSRLFINNNATVYFNQLNINSDHSKIELNDHAFVNDLNVQLIKSEINDKEAVIRNLTMDADSKSSVTLSGNNIKALK